MSPPCPRGSRDTQQGQESPCGTRNFHPVQKCETGNLPGQPGRSSLFSPLSATSPSHQQRGIFVEIGIGREAKREKRVDIVDLSAAPQGDELGSRQIPSSDPGLTSPPPADPKCLKQPQNPAFCWFFFPRKQLSQCSPKELGTGVAAPSSGCSGPTSLPPFSSLSHSRRDLQAPAPPREPWEPRRPR